MPGRTLISSTAMAISIHPLTPTLGAELRGVDLAEPLEEETTAGGLLTARNIAVKGFVNIFCALEDLYKLWFEWANDTWREVQCLGGTPDLVK